ncbi:MAG TPA: hypothetical protein DCX70_08000 [Chitinophagaceae bacterium]|jgi:hypothetical protein|nr:hypothetical protein [Chitinophagaceae bacterium]
MLAFVLWVLWAFQMCCNLRRAVRDFELNVLELEGERNFVLGLRTTRKYMILPQSLKKEISLKTNTLFLLLLNFY